MTIKSITHLKILGKDYEVRWFDYDENTEQNLYGRQDWSRGILYVRNDLDETRALDTLIHELIHALDGEMRIFPEMEGLNKESIIDRLGAGLQCIVRDNWRAIIEALGGELK